MELKPIHTYQFRDVSRRFNRTFMELKPMTNVLQITFNNSFNRTFMELKHNEYNSPANQMAVLIGPSWN